MGYTSLELQRKLEKYSTYYVDVGILRGELDDKELELIEHRIEDIKTLLGVYEREEGIIVYKSSDPLLPKMIVVDGIKNSIMNSYGGVKEFVKGYGGDFFDEERVEWFVKNKEYFHPKVWGFVNDWNICFPS